MADFLLDSSGDLDLSTNDIQIVSGLAAIRQELQIRFRFFLGEWFLNREEGVSYIRDVLVKNPNEPQVLALLSEVARSTPGVEVIRSFLFDLDSATRALTGTGEFGANIDDELVFAPFVVEVEL